MKPRGLVVHVFSDWFVENVSETTRQRWRERLKKARLENDQIIHVTPNWPLRQAANTGLQIYSTEPVFWDPVRTVLDCRQLDLAINFGDYHSIEIVGVCPDAIAAASRNAIRWRYPGSKVDLDTLHLDETKWSRRMNGKRSKT